jgi:DNA-directed RNA polymerase subunit H (RpoH/RPB5)
MNSRTETADEDGLGVAADNAPHAALLLAQEQENARVTLYRCMRTLIRMMEVRGYDIKDVGGHNMAATGLEMFKNKRVVEEAESSRRVILVAVVPTEAPRLTTSWATGMLPGSRLGVIAIDQGNVGTMREVLATMQERNLTTLILVSRQPLTAYSKKFLVDSTEEGKSIQHFQYADLQAAIVDHKLVPRHAPLNSAMTKIVKDRFIGGKFPRLLTTDPMVKFLGLPLGAVVSVREVFGREQAVITYFEVHDVY